MAEPFDTLAAQQVATFQALMSVQMTPEEAEAAIAEVFETLSLNSGVLEAVKATLGRVRGMFVVSAPPSDFLGVPGSTAFDPTNRIWYGPKDAVTGWPDGVAFIDQGPAGVISSVTTEIIAAGEAVEVVAGGSPENRTLTFRLPDVTTLYGLWSTLMARGDLYRLGKHIDYVRFLERGDERLYAEDFYRFGTEVEDAFTDRAGVTFTRATGGYAPRSDGVYQWFAANALRVTDRGVLTEPAATNLLPRFAPTVAQLNSTSNTSNAAEAASPPIPGLQWLNLDNTGGTATAYLFATIPGSTVCVFSALVEAPDGIQPVFGFNSTTGDFRFVLGSTAISSGTVRYERLSGNVWRVYVSSTSPASPGQTQGVQRASGQNTRALKFSGFQLEVGSVGTSPIASAGTATTRPADVLNETAALTSSEDVTIYGASEFTREATTTVRVFQWHDGAGERIIVSRTSAGNFQLTVSGGGTNTTVASVAKAGPRTVKFAVVREAGIYRFHVDGVAQTITPPTVPAGALTTMSIGQDQTDSLQLTDFLKSLVTMRGVALAAADAALLTA